MRNEAETDIKIVQTLIQEMEELKKEVEKKQEQGEDTGKIETQFLIKASILEGIQINILFGELLKLKEDNERLREKIKRYYQNEIVKE